jgi:hypothetical protein
MTKPEIRMKPEARMANRHSGFFIDSDFRFRISDFRFSSPACHRWDDELRDTRERRGRFGHGGEEVVCVLGTKFRLVLHEPLQGLVVHAARAAIGPVEECQTSIERATLRVEGQVD